MRHSRTLCGLLDESVPHQVRAFLRHHGTYTAVYAGFKGFKNGALLKAVEDNGFDVLVTADQTLPYEQNLKGRKLALVCISANSWKVVRPHVAQLVAIVDSAMPGSLTRVGTGAFVRRSRPPTQERG